MTGAAAAVLGALAVVAAQIFHGGLLRPALALPALAVLAGAGVLAGVQSLRRGGQPAPAALPVALAAGLGAWLLARCASAPPTWEAGGMVWLVLGALAMFLMFAAGVTNPRDRLVFFAVLAAMALVQSAVGAWQFVRRVEDLPLGWFSEQLRIYYTGRLDGWRAHGFYINGNHLAWFLNVSALAMLAAAAWSRWASWGRVLALYAAKVALAGSMISLSRGGYIGLATGLSLLCLGSALVLLRARGGRRLPAALAIVGSLLLAAGAVWLVRTESARVQTRMAAIGEDVYRPKIFDAALRQWQLDPLWGGGPGSFAGAARRLRNFGSETDDLFAHNDWLQLPAEFGFPAFALALLLVMSLMAGGFGALGGILSRRMARTGMGSSHAVAVQLAALAGLGACAAHSVFDFNMQIAANALLAAACAGMLANPGVVSGGPAGWVPRVWGLFAALLCLAVSALLAARVMLEGPRDRMLLAAENAWLAGAPEVAVGMLDGLVERNPRDAAALGMRGRAKVDLARRQESPERQRGVSFQASRDLLAAAELRPAGVFDEVAFAYALGRSGDAEGAARAAARAVALFPTWHGGYEALGLALEARGKTDEALAIYELGAAQPGAHELRARLNAFRRQKR